MTGPCRIRTIAFVLGLAILLSLSVSAVVDAGLPGPSDATFVRLTAAAGLSQDSVYAILQDHDGFIWLGTQEGLDRYDGYSFKVFKQQPNDPRSLPNNWVSCLYEDRQHRLWVGTLGGLSQFDRETETFRNWRPVPGAVAGPDANNVTSIREDRRGRLWVATVGSGLYRVEPSSGQFVAHYQHDEHDKASLSSDKVEVLYEDRAGRLWVGTTGGLDLFDVDRGRFVHHARSDDPESLSHNWVWDLAEDAAGRIWVATFGGGISVLDPANGRFHRYDPRDGAKAALPNRWITRIFIDDAGGVWVGTDGSGLLRYDPRTDRFVAYENRPRDPGSLSQNVVRSIYQDAQKNLWVGTFSRGLNILQSDVPGFSYFNHDPGRSETLGAPTIQRFAQDAAGRLWIGTGEHGLDLLDPATGTFTHFRHDSRDSGSLSRDIVTALYADHAGRLWVGTHGGGLDRLDVAHRRFEHHTHAAGVDDSIGDDYVWDITEDREGSLWLATNQGLDRYDVATGRFTHFRHSASDPRSLASDEVRALLFDPDGNLWIGTLGGISVLRKGATAFEHFRNDPEDTHSLPNDVVVTFYMDARKRLWIGTLGGGLALLDPSAGGRFVSFRAADGLPSDSVSCVAAGGDHQLWLGTYNGLAAFDPETHVVRSFGPANGLRARSLQFAMGGCMAARDDRLFFASSDGVVVVRPLDVRQDSYRPRIAFTGLRLFEQPVKLERSLLVSPEIRLAHWQNVVSLEFVALDYTFPRGNEYAYKLNGFSTGWTKLGAKHEVTFTNMNAGTYVLDVMASNRDGVWSDALESLRIVVTPPFWATWWFRSLLGLALVLGVALLHELRVRRLNAHARELALRVEEAVAKVKVLRGLLPMCAWCKKIRDDRGYWSQIEAYLSKHSEVDFSHGICPDCSAKIRNRPGGDPTPPSDRAV